MEELETRQAERNARREGRDRLVLTGRAARHALRRQTLHRLAGLLVVAAGMFEKPVRNLIVGSEGQYSGPGPGWRYPLSSGVPVRWYDVVAIFGLMILGLLILWVPWGRYETVEAADDPPRVVLVRRGAGSAKDSGAEPL